MSAPFCSLYKRTTLQLHFYRHHKFRFQLMSSSLNSIRTIYNCRTVFPALSFNAFKNPFSAGIVNLSLAKSNNIIQVQQYSSNSPNSDSPNSSQSSGSEITASRPLSPVPASLRRTVDEYFIQYQPTRVRDEAVSFEEASRVFTVPNALSFARLVSGPVVGYLILTAQLQLAAPLFLFAAVTDWVYMKVYSYSF